MGADYEVWGGSGSNRKTGEFLVTHARSEIHLAARILVCRRRGVAHTVIETDLGSHQKRDG